MAKFLKTLAPVDSMSGMVGKREETVSSKAFIINVKKVGSWKIKGAPFMYFSVRQNDRMTPVKENELAARAKFKDVVIATRQRMLDPNHADMDQLQFSRQTKYPTLYGYVFSQVWAEYEH